MTALAMLAPVETINWAAMSNPLIKTLSLTLLRGA
jgi:hypothetical protein